MYRLNYLIAILVSLVITSSLAFGQGPSTQARSISFSKVGQNDMRITWINGNGGNRIVVLATNEQDITDITSSTLSGNTYDDGDGVYGSGDQINNTAYAVYSGSGRRRAVEVSNLLASTTYYAKVFEFNYSGGSTNYNADDAANNPRYKATGLAPIDSTSIMFDPGSVTAQVSWLTPNDDYSYIIDLYDNDNNEYHIDYEYADIGQASSHTGALSRSFNLDYLDVETEYGFKIKSVYDGEESNWAPSQFYSKTFTTIADNSTASFTIYYQDSDFANDVAASSTITSGDIAYLIIESTEPLDVNPTVHIDMDGSGDFTDHPNDLSNYTNTRALSDTKFYAPVSIDAVSDSDMNGNNSHTVVIYGTDYAYNSASYTASTTYEIFVDNQRPVTSGVFVNSGSYTIGETISATFVTDESGLLGNSYTISLNDETTGATGWGVTDLGSGSYSASFTLESEDTFVDEAGGTNLSLSFSITDDAGNSSTLSTRDNENFTIIGGSDYVIDAVAPEVSSVQFGTTQIYDFEYSQTVTITFNENMTDDDDNIAATFTSNPSMSITASGWDSPTQYSMTFTHFDADLVTNETINSLSFTFATGVFADNAGNTMTAYTSDGTFNIDTDNPEADFTLSSGTINLSTLTQEIDVVFTEDMDTETIPSVSFTSTNFDYVDGEWNGSDTWSVTFTHDGTSEYNATESATIYANANTRDEVGNYVTQTFSSNFVLDTRMPSVTITLSSGSITSNTLTQSLTFTFDEPMNTTIAYADLEGFQSSSDSFTTLDDENWIDNQNYSITLTHNANEETDASATFAITADGGFLDANGNGNSATISDTYVLDTDLPGVSNISFDTNPIYDSEYSQTVTVTFDESVVTSGSASFSATFTGNPSMSLTQANWNSATEWAGTYTHFGNEETVASSSFYISSGTFVDLNGNWNPAITSSNSFRVDTDNPEADLSLSSTTINTSNTLQVITIDFTEAMDQGTVPSVSFTSTNFSYVDGDWTDEDTWSVTFSHDMTIENSVESASLSGTVTTDVSGNLATATFSDTFTIDTERPSVTMTVASGTINTSNRDQVITFTFDEPMNTTIAYADLTIDEQSAYYSLQAESWASSTVYNLTLRHSNNNQVTYNPATFTILEDAGFLDLNGNGNGSTISNTYTLDNDSPDVSSISISNSLVYDGDDVQIITVTFDEDIDIENYTPSITFTGNPDLSSTSQSWLSATQFSETFTHNGSEETRSSSSVTIGTNSVFDLNGNGNELSTSDDDFDIDTDNPDIISYSNSESVINSTNLVQVISVTFEEAMDTEAMTSISFTSNNFDLTASTWTSGNTVYTATYTHNATEEGSSTESATFEDDGFTDVAGNYNTVTFTDSFTLDTQIPVISVFTVESSSLSVGQVASATITADEAGYSANYIRWYDKNVEASLTDLGSGSYSVSFTIQPGDDESGVQFDVSLTDPAGNNSTTYDEVDFAATIINGTGNPNTDYYIDGIKPEISDIAFDTDPITTNDYVQIVTIDFNEDMDVSSTYSVTFTPNDPSMTITSASWTGIREYTITYTHTETEETLASNSFTISGGQFADVAGNILDAIASSTLDEFDIDTDYPSATVTWEIDPVYQGGLKQYVNAVYDEDMDQLTTPSLSFSDMTYITFDGGNWEDSRTWSATFTHDGTEEYRAMEYIELNGGDATDLVGNIDNSATSSTFTLDTDFPSATVSVASTTINMHNLDQIITVDFDEAMNVSKIPSISFTSTNFAYTAGNWDDNQTWSVTFTHNDTEEELTESATINGTVAIDIEGNFVPSTFSSNFVLDTEQPEVTNIQFSNNDITSNSLTQVVTVSFSEAMTDAFTSASATITENPSMSFTSYNWTDNQTLSLTYTHFGNEETISSLSFNITDQTAYTDINGNDLQNFTSTISEFDVDTDLPSAIITWEIDPIYQGGLKQYVKASYDEDMDQATTPSLSFSDMTYISFDGGNWEDSRTWSATFTHDGTEETRPMEYIELNGGAATDLVGNADNSATSSTFVLDTDYPDAVITLSASTITSNTLTQIYSITFDEPMNTSSTFEFDLGSNNYDVVDAQWISSTYYSATYTHDGTEEGLYVADANIELNTVFDVNGNTSNTTSTTYHLDTDLPNITVVEFTDGDFGIDEWTVLTITTNPAEDYLSLTSASINDIDVSANIQNLGSGSYSLTYTVSEGDEDRTSVTTIPLSLVMSDVNGNLSNSLPTNTSEDQTTVDGTRPVLTAAYLESSSGQNLNDHWKIGDDITVTIVSDANTDGNEYLTQGTALTSFGTQGTFTVNGEEVTSFALDATAGNSQTYTAIYTVVSGNEDADTESDVELELALVDAAGNSSTNTISFSDVNTFKVDANYPTAENYYYLNPDFNIPISDLTAPYTPLVLTVPDQFTIAVFVDEPVLYNLSSPAASASQEPKIIVDAQGENNDISETTLKHKISTASGSTFYIQRSSIVDDLGTDGTVQESTTFKMVDLAGNASTFYPTNWEDFNAYVDATPPSFTFTYYEDAAYTNPIESGRRLKPDTYYVKIDASEPVLETATFTISTEASTFNIEQNYAGAGNTTTFGYTRVIHSDEELQATIPDDNRMTSTDTDGNELISGTFANSDVYEIYTDTKRPDVDWIRLTFENEEDDIVNIDNNSMTVSVIYDEEMDTETRPTVTFTGNPQMDETSVIGWSTYDDGEGTTITNAMWEAVYTHDLTSENHNSVTATVADASGAQDLAGNDEDGGNSSSFIIDTERPDAVMTYESSTVNIDMNRQVVYITFDEEMDTDSSPSVSFSSSTNFDFVGDNWDSSISYSATYDHNLTAEELTDGLELNSNAMSAYDARGNYTNFANTPSFVLDTKRPSATYFVSDIDPIYQDDLTQEVTIRFDEDMDTNFNPLLSSNVSENFANPSSTAWNSSTEFYAEFVHDGDEEEISQDYFEMAGTVARDVNGNNTSATTSTTFQIDTDYPGISSSYWNNTVINTKIQSTTLTLVFDEDMDNESSVESLTPDSDEISPDDDGWLNNTTYWISFGHSLEIETDLSSIVSFDGSGLNDIVGNEVSDFDSPTFTIDTDKPDYTLSLSGSTINVANTNLIVTADFNEQMETFESDPSFTFLSLGNLSQGSGDWIDNTSYSFTLVHDTDAESRNTATFGIDNSTGAVDLRDNFVNVTTATITVDTENPTGDVSVATNPINFNNLATTVTVVYDEDMITSLDPSVTFSNHSGSFMAGVSGWLGSDTYYASYTWSGVTEDDISVGTQNDGGALDLAGNPEIGGSATFRVDTQPPSATLTITRNGTEYDLSNDGKTFTITADFDEDITNAVTMDIAIDVPGAGDIAATAMTRENSTQYTYDWTVNNAGDGDVTFTLTNGEDLNGNMIDDGNLTYDPFGVDNTAPSFTLFTFTTVNNSNASVVFSEGVYTSTMTDGYGTGDIVSTIDDFNLTNTNDAKPVLFSLTTVSHEAGDSTATVAFALSGNLADGSETYTIDGKVANALFDEAGNPLVLGSAAAGELIRQNRITDFAFTVPNGDYNQDTDSGTEGGNIEFEIVFERNTTVSDVNVQLPLSTGTATYLSANANTITFEYDVQDGENSADLTTDNSASFSVEDVFLDDRGFVSQDILPSASSIAANHDIVIDTEEPIITIGDPDVTLINNSGTVAISITFTEADNVSLTIVDGGPGNVSITATGDITSYDETLVTDFPNSATYYVYNVEGDGTFTQFYVGGQIIGVDEITDDAGNVAEDVTKSIAIEVDNTAPEVSISSGPSKSIVNLAGSNESPVEYEITITGGASSPSFSDNSVTVETSETASVSSTFLGYTTNEGEIVSATYGFYNATGNGEVAFSVNAGVVLDLAGNSSTASAISSGSFTVDNIGPSTTFVSISSSNTFDDQIAGQSDVVTISIATDEAIDDLSIDSEVNSNPGTETVHSSTSFTIAYNPNLIDNECEVPFSVTFTDLAGNTALVEEGDVTDASSVTYDKTSPSATITVSSNTLSIDSNTMTVTWYFDEDMNTDYQALYYIGALDGFTFPLQNPSDESFEWVSGSSATMGVALVNTADSEGSGTVSNAQYLNLIPIDIAGNVTNEGNLDDSQNTFHWDFERPEASFEISEPLVGTDLNKSTTLTISENHSGLADDDLITNVGSASISQTFSDNVYEVIITGDATYSGGIELKIDSGVFFDRVGNTNTASNAVTYTIDDGAPDIISLDIFSDNSNNNAWASVGQIVTITFTANEAINSSTVTISNRNSNQLITAYTDDNENFTATYTIDNTDDNEGDVEFTVEVQDAGSLYGSASHTFSSSTVTIDKTDPNLSYSLTSTSINRTNNSITLTLTSDDIIHDVTGFSASGSEGIQHISSNQVDDYTYAWVFTHDLTQVDASGNANVGFGSLENIAGLVSDVNSFNTITIDTDYPEANNFAPVSSPSSESSVSFTIGWDQNLDGNLVLGDITIDEGGTDLDGDLDVTLHTNSSSYYILELSGMSASGSISATINANTVMDVYGNQNEDIATSSLDYIFIEPFTSIDLSRANVSETVTPNSTFKVLSVTFTDDNYDEEDDLRPTVIDQLIINRPTADASEYDYNDLFNTAYLGFSASTYSTDDAGSTIGTGSITFNLDPSRTISDNSSDEFEIYVQSNSTFAINVDNIVPHFDLSGSNISNEGNSTRVDQSVHSSKTISGNNAQFEINATTATFTQQPAEGASIERKNNTTFKVATVDNYGNLDLDYVSTLGISANVEFTTTNDVTASSGTASFTTTLDEASNSASFSTTNGAGLINAGSNTFKVTLPQATGFTIFPATGKFTVKWDYGADSLSVFMLVRKNAYPLPVDPTGDESTGVSSNFASASDYNGSAVQGKKVAYGIGSPDFGSFRKVDVTASKGYYGVVIYKFDGSNSNPVYSPRSSNLLGQSRKDIFITDDSDVIFDFDNSEFDLGEVYPNPVKSELNFNMTVENPSIFTFDLYDMKGTKLATLEENKTLNQGIHLIRYSLDNEIHSGRYVLMVTNSNGIAEILQIVVER